MPSFEQQHKLYTSPSWLTTLATAACFAKLAQGHGMLTVPSSRNVEHNCGHCLNAGGPAAVRANGAYLHGMCGNNADDADQNWAAASDSPQLIGTSGDSFEVQVVITAHHHGFFEFELCDSPDISEQCFRSRRLYRTGCDPAEEGEAVCRRWWKVLNSNELNHYSLEPQGYPDGAPYTNANSCNRVLYTAFYDIPDDVSCTHCVLRWHWHTTNSCTSPTSTSEEFWNCADVRIDAPDGAETVDTSPADLAALNGRLTATLPEDLSGIETDDDYWACPQPSYGLPGEYSCSLDGTVEDTSGCVAYTEGETCEVDYFENDDVVALGKPLWSYCTWSFCLTSGQNEPSTDYCDQSEMRCSGCGGTWCQGHDGDLPTTAARETTTLAISTTKIFTTTRNAVDTTGGTLPTISSTIQTTLPVEKTTSAAASTTSATNGYCSWYTCNGSTNNAWCDQKKSNCEGACNGVWCPGNTEDTVSSTSTTAQATNTAHQETTSKNGWLTGLNATHFWDCNGGACDATTLNPWDDTLYKYAAQYAPQDPADHGGAKYGEAMWMTGAASDALSQLLGSDDGCCGAEGSGVGGCGKCVLVRNPLAINSDWTAVVMKKNRCPPWSNGCEAGKLHLDIAAPGFDNLEFSTSNICGNDQRTDTYLSQHESSMCGDWYNVASSTDLGCDCSAMRSDTPELALLKRGCERFAAWGWTSGNPQLEYTTVACPSAFVDLIEGAFSSDGVQDADGEKQNTPTPVTTNAKVDTSTVAIDVTTRQHSRTSRTRTRSASTEQNMANKSEATTTVSPTATSPESDMHADAIATISAKVDVLTNLVMQMYDLFERSECMPSDR